MGQGWHAASLWLGHPAHLICSPQFFWQEVPVNPWDPQNLSKDRWGITIKSQTPVLLFHFRKLGHKGRERGLGIATEMSFLTKSPHPSLIFPAKKEMPADWSPGSSVTKIQNERLWRGQGTCLCTYRRGCGAGQRAGD